MLLVLAFTCSVCLHLAAAMDAPSNEFGANDLLSLGLLDKGDSKSGSTSNAPQQVLLIATAKISGRAHLSKPYLTADIVNTLGGSCGLFDWIFNSACPAPESGKKIHASRVVPLPYSFLNIYRLPTNWMNLRVTLPTYSDACGRDGSNDRTAHLRVSSVPDVCNEARFHRRHCYKVFLVFEKCELKDCETLNFLSRLVTYRGPGHVDTVYYVARENGIGKCSKPVQNLFLK